MSKNIIDNQHNGHEFVDIGGIKWATCNVGAEKPTDFGLYFQWGDRKGYTFDEVGKTKIFDWRHYKHYNGKRLTKYNQIDKKQVLDLRDDAAFAYMGHGWRMPTQDEFRYLFDNITCRRTNNYKNSGVAGMVFTDRTDATKELFFPAAGFCTNRGVDYVGLYGFYWTSSLYSGDALYGCYIYFNNGCEDWPVGRSRYNGYPIRGILTV